MVASSVLLQIQAFRFTAVSDRFEVGRLCTYWVRRGARSRRVAWETAALRRSNGDCATAPGAQVQVGAAGRPRGYSKTCMVVIHWCIVTCCCSAGTQLD